MKIELLKQRFMHLSLIVGLIVGSTMTTHAAPIDTTISNVVETLKNNGRADLAGLLENSKRELIELFRQIKDSIDKNHYSANVERIHAEFQKLKNTILIPMAGDPNCQAAHAELNKVFADFERLLQVLHGLKACNPSMRKVAAFARLKPFTHLIPDAAA